MKVKMYGRLLIAAVVIFTAVSELPLAAEAVFLKNGSIVNGTIEADSADAVTLRQSDNKVKRILRKDIMRILYTELKMGKIYIQKRDGKGVVAFMVDEDQQSYTFRKELYVPEEFILKRSEVLFISEKNPSGLQVVGEVGTDRVSLEWQPPYDAVKKYNLYIKKNEKDKYKIIDSTGSKSITLKNLSSNTTYYLIVTSVDSSDYESSPSNELKIKTQNIPPTEPAGIIREMKKDKLVIKWKESKDSDGKVKEYNVYNRDEKEKGKLATVKTPEYTVPDTVSVYKLEITSVDDLNAESDRANVPLPLQLVISVAPAGFIATGNLGESFNPGYGLLLNIGLRNFIFDNFEAGINTGYISLKGKAEANMNMWEFIPAAVYAGYHLRAGNWFSFFPYLKAGESFSSVKYTGFSGDKSKSVTDPMAAAGLSLTGSSDNLTFSIGADYGILVESKSMKPFYEAFISCGILIEL